MKQRDMWNVSSDKDVAKELEALEGLLQAQEEAQ